MIPEESFGAALVYFTGSKAHNIAIRKRAQNRGLKVSEYGVFRDATRIAGRTGSEVYRALGLDFIEPELREDRGEVEAAELARLPVLVTLHDIKGDLHAHTSASLRNPVQREVLAGSDHERIFGHPPAISPGDERSE